MPLRTALLALVLVPVLVAPARAEDKAIPAATQSAAVMVPSPVEDEAIAFRKLQSELMVATLSCKDARITAHYNIFVSRFRPALRDNARVLKAYFRRLYGSAGQHKLDDFITRLANEASLASMGQPHFCTNALARFEAINHADQDQTAGMIVEDAELVLDQ